MLAFNPKLPRALFPLLTAALLSAGCSESTAPSTDKGSSGASPTAGLAVSPTASAPASAVWQSTCKATSVSSGWRVVSRFVFAQGVGAIAWRVALNGTARDRCSHGYLSGSISLDMGGLLAKDSRASLNPVVYFRTTRSSTWRRAPFTGSGGVLGPIRTFGWSASGSNHLDLVPTERVTQIKLITQATLLNAVSLPHTLTCSFITRTCS